MSILSSLVMAIAMSILTGAPALLGIDGVFESHPNIARILALAIFFLGGCFEAAIFKKKDMACATWFCGLGALTAWIAYPLTRSRISFGVMVFVSGVILLVVYYKKRRFAPE